MNDLTARGSLPRSAVDQKFRSRKYRPPCVYFTMFYDENKLIFKLHSRSTVCVYTRNINLVAIWNFNHRNEIWKLIQVSPIHQSWNPFGPVSPIDECLISDSEQQPKDGGSLAWLAWNVLSILSLWEKSFSGLPLQQTWKTDERYCKEAMNLKRMTSFTQRVFLRHTMLVMVHYLSVCTWSNPWKWTSN